MKHLLSDYIFDDSLRYEGHCLIYGKEEDRLEIGGFLGAAVLGALLSGTDEGRERSIFLNIRDGRKEFFDRYEDETLHENGGFFSKEVQALSEAYMEINGDLSLLLSICGNERLYDLAFGLMMDYMEKLVEEQVGEHIYDVFQWTTPFAQWLFTAGFVETRRQQLLAIDWSDPAGVYSLAEFINKPQEEIEPTFVFENERAEDLLNGYYNWLMAAIEQEAALYPDAKVQLAALKEKVRLNEPDYEFLKPEMKDFKAEQINLFRKWMNQWTDFVKTKIEPPVSSKKKDIRQELFPDNITPIPQSNDYSAVREYIHDRSKYDAEFKKYQKSHYLTDFCQQLTFIFDWPVEYNSLYKSLKRRLKHPKKDHLPK